MPPRRTSRYLYTEGIRDTSDRFYLTERIPFRFKALADNRQHRVGVGDTLHQLAARYFKRLRRPAGYWWVIADFQPVPIFDPTIALVPGSVIVIPSVRTLLEEVFNEARRRESE